MAYKTGTTNGRVRMGTYSDGDGFGIAGGNVSTQTVLANNLKPPVDNAELALILVIAVCSIGVFILSILIFNIIGASSFLGLLGFAVISPALAVCAGIMVWKSRKPRLLAAKREFQKAMHKWSHSWICLRCGKSWVIN
jgi:hypothetical protein